MAAPRRGKRKAPSTLLNLGEAERTATASRPTPTDRLVEARSDHIASLDREREHLLQDLEVQRSESRRLQAELDRLRPTLARAEADLRNLSTSVLMASILVAAGGAAVSAAGYFEDTYKRPILVAGVAVLACGLLFQVAAGWRQSRQGPPPATPR